MNGFEFQQFQQRLSVALWRKYGEVWGADLDAEVPGMTFGGDVRTLIDNVITDTTLAHIDPGFLEKLEGGQP